MTRRSVVRSLFNMFLTLPTSCADGVIGLHPKCSRRSPNGTTYHKGTDTFAGRVGLNRYNDFETARLKVKLRAVSVRAILMERRGRASIRGRDVGGYEGRESVHSRVLSCTVHNRVIL